MASAEGRRPSDDFKHTLLARIRADGPLPLADFMAASNAAYYARGDVFGARGDFITAPEISQIFGELIGLWAVVTWQSMGSPAVFHLVECGPGRGTLMADALRAGARRPEFREAARIHLVEQSAALVARQKETLSAHPVQWHARLEDVPRGPALVLANEFLDALPIMQFIHTDTGWEERLVSADAKDELFFTSRPAAGIDLPAAEAGDICERAPAVDTFVAGLAARLAHGGGAALLIDYGYVQEALGDTLQAVRAHTYAPVLAAPGESDLTAHVNFDAVARTARRHGVRVHGPVGQGAWLTRLGIEVRAKQLAAGKLPQTRDEITAAVRRLTDPAAMGSLFKVMAFTHDALPPPEGFATAP